MHVTRRFQKISSGTRRDALQEIPVATARVEGSFLSITLFNKDMGQRLERYLVGT